MAYPFDSIVTLALVVGIWLVVLGVAEIIFGFGMRSDAKKVEKFTTGDAHSHAAAARPVSQTAGSSSGTSPRRPGLRL